MPQRWSPTLLSVTKWYRLTHFRSTSACIGRNCDAPGGTASDKNQCGTKTQRINCRRRHIYQSGLSNTVYRADLRSEPVRLAARLKLNRIGRDCCMNVTD